MGGEPEDGDVYDEWDECDYEQLYFLLYDKCCLCDDSLSGHGNNAQPLKDGKCCPKCNLTKVIPARLSA